MSRAFDCLFCRMNSLVELRRKMRENKKKEERKKVNEKGEIQYEKTKRKKEPKSM